MNFTNKILSFFMLIILLLPLSTFSVHAASLSTSKDRHYVYLTFPNLKNVARVSYVLTYNSRGIQKGFEGGFKTSSKMTRTTRRQILGTCSTHYCTYHASPSNFELTTTYYLRSGGKTTSTTKL